MPQILVVANRTLLRDELVTALIARHEEAPGTSFHVVLPARDNVETDQAFAESEHATWPGEAMVVTAERLRLKTALERFREAGLEIDGEVIVEGVYRAAVRAFDRGGFDEVIVSTLPAGVSRWLGLDVPNRLRRRLSCPVSHVEAASNGD